MVVTVAKGKRLAPLSECLKTGLIIFVAENSRKIRHRKHDWGVEVAVLLAEDLERFSVVTFSLGKFPLLVERQRQRLKSPGGFRMGRPLQAAMKRHGFTGVLLADNWVLHRFGKPMLE